LSNPSKSIPRVAKFALAGMWVTVSVLVWIPFGPEWSHTFKQALFVIGAWAPLILLVRFDRYPNWLRGLWASIFLFALGLYLLDMAARPILNDPVVYQRYPAMPFLWRLTADMDANLTAHQGLARMSGDLTTFPMVETSFVTDHHGFRNEQGARKEPINLVLLGDSFGIGSLVNQDETWGHLFDSAYGLNCYNLSALGTPWHHVFNLTLESPRLELDRGTLVIWALFTGNDLSDYYGEFPFPHLEGGFSRSQTKLDIIRKKSPVRNLFVREPMVSKIDQEVLAVQVKGRDILFYEKYARIASLSATEVETHPNFEMMSVMFSEMRRMADAENLRVVVVLIPTKEETYPYLLPGRGDLLTPELRQGMASGFSTVVESLCGREDFPFLDLKLTFFPEASRRWEKSGDLLWFAADTHWNGAGHAVAARETAAFLRSRGLLD